MDEEGAELSFFRQGSTFRGTQEVQHPQADSEDTKKESWKVDVRVHECDLAKGSVCGSMKAWDLPSTNNAVVTYWEGEIIDNKNFGFLAGKWESSPQNDLSYWGRLPGYSAISSAMNQNSGQNIDTSTLPHLYMRWKEQYFINSDEECGLTIAGFYFCALEKSTGKILGYYFDPNSTPYQKLSLEWDPECPNGIGFVGYEFR